MSIDLKLYLFIYNFLSIIYLSINVVIPLYSICSLKYFFISLFLHFFIPILLSLFFHLVMSYVSFSPFFSSYSLFVCSINYTFLYMGFVYIFMFGTFYLCIYCCIDPFVYLSFLDFFSKNLIILSGFFSFCTITLCIYSLGSIFIDSSIPQIFHYFITFFNFLLDYVLIHVFITSKELKYLLLSVHGRIH